MNAIWLKNNSKKFILIFSSNLLVEFEKEAYKFAAHDGRILPGREEIRLFSSH